MRDEPSTRHESNRAFYDRISRAYDFIADSHEHKAREAGEQALDLKHGEAVLEIGFGTGGSIINLARLVGETGKVCGIDISTGMLEVAWGKIEREGLGDRIELRVGDAHRLPYENATFDAVFASFTLELFPPDDIPEVLAEAHRVLKTGGRIGIVSMSKVPDGDHESLLEKAYVWMHRHFPHIVDCEPIDVEGLVRAGGFEPVRRIEMKIWTMPVTAVIGRK